MRRKTRKERFSEWLSRPYMLLIYRLFATLMALSISRWLLYLFNLQFFHQLDIGQALALYFYGMRFDLPIVVGINLPTIIYYCFPSRRIYNKTGQKVIDIIYVVLNAIAILLNFIDIICFHFFAKHITIDFLKVLGRSDEVSFGIIRQVFFDYWYLLIIYILFVSVIIVVASHTRLQSSEKRKKTQDGRFGKPSVWLSCCCYRLSPIVEGFSLNLSPSIPPCVTPTRKTHLSCSTRRSV